MFRSIQTSQPLVNNNCNRSFAILRPSLKFKYADPCAMSNRTTDVLRATLDADNSMCVLRGNALVLSKILEEVDAHYEAHIDRVSVSWISLGTQNEFPAPTGININMMPIDLDDPYRLPTIAGSYSEMIRSCGISRYNTHNSGQIYKPRVAYLTISEELVSVGQPHRRPGLHIERPGTIEFGGKHVKADVSDNLFVHLAWGLGCWGRSGKQGIPIDGIYMASNVKDSCKIYTPLILRPEHVTDAHGGIEHMRNRLGDGKGLAANEIVWFTDRTPHESLPIPSEPDGSKEVYRQFFRLVVGPISVWYSKHNTSNPDGLQPDARISDSDKFASNELDVI